jgi:hypothetical protein
MHWYFWTYEHFLRDWWIFYRIIYVLHRFSSYTYKDVFIYVSYKRYMSYRKNIIKYIEKKRHKPWTKMIKQNMKVSKMPVGTHVPWCEFCVTGTYHLGHLFLVYLHMNEKRHFKSSHFSSWGFETWIVSFKYIALKLRY